MVEVNSSAPSSRPEATGRAGSSFPRRVRLLRHSDFERVYKKGRRQFAGHCTLFYLWRAESGGPRIGFTVGKALGGAVERNRIKRRLREAVRLNRLRVSSPVDIVVNPRKSVLTVKFSELEKEISRAFEAIQKFANALPQGNH
jgi:ribonuclease P protein component